MQENLGARPLRALRAERLLTLRDLARAAGVGPRTVTRIETGQEIPRAAVRERIASVLGVEPAAVAEFRDRGYPEDDEAARRLERMGYPSVLARRAVGRRP